MEHKLPIYPEMDCLKQQVVKKKKKAFKIQDTSLLEKFKLKLVIKYKSNFFKYRGVLCICLGEQAIGQENSFSSLFHHLILTYTSLQKKHC